MMDCIGLCGGETDEELARGAKTPVWLHVYDVGHAKVIQDIDVAVKDFLKFGGVFHGAVQVFDREWSFGCTRQPKTGVFCCKPKGCPMHTYRESHYMVSRDRFRVTERGNEPLTRRPRFRRASA